MNIDSTIAIGIAKPTVRKMNHDELPNVVTRNLRRFRADGASCPHEKGQLREQVGWVAEVRDRSVGFVVCAVIRATLPLQSAALLHRLARFFRSLLGWRGVLPLYIELLDFEVLPEAGWPMIEHTLLNSLVEDLKRFWGCVPVVVPESNLTAQVFLRNARYKAVQVLHGYYGDEDGYLMTNEIDGAPRHDNTHDEYGWEESLMYG